MIQRKMSLADGWPVLSLGIALAALASGGISLYYMVNNHPQLPESPILSDVPDHNEVIPHNSISVPDEFTLMENSNDIYIGETRTSDVYFVTLEPQNISVKESLESGAKRYAQTVYHTDDFIINRVMNFNADDSLDIMGFVTINGDKVYFKSYLNNALKQDTCGWIAFSDDKNYLAELYDNMYTNHTENI